MFTKYATAIIALAALASAIPHSSKEKEPRVLQHDDVILPRVDGGYDIMKDWEWETIERRLERQAREAFAIEAKRAVVAGENIPVGALTRRDADLQKRDCDRSMEVQILEDFEFTDWDVPMSPVIGATGGAATIMVTKGFSVANAVSISFKEDLSPVPTVLTMSLGIETSWTWTSTDSQSFSFTITPGQYGVVVSNPLVRRVIGNVLSGCTDYPMTESFVVDSHFNQTFGDLLWVEGPIRLCNSTTYPVPYCTGSGMHT